MHYQQNQPQGFPVPIMPANTAMMVPQNLLPNTPPFVIPVQIHPQFQQLIPLFTGGVVLMLQQNSQKNPLRSFHFNLLSSNGWNNQDLVNTVNTAGKIFDFLMATQGQRGMQPIQALENAVNDAVMFNLVDVVGKFSQGLQPYIDQVMANDLNTTANRAGQIMTQVNQFFQSLNMGGGNQFVPGYGAPAGGPTVTTMGGGNLPSWMQGQGAPMGAPGYGAPGPGVPAHLAGPAGGYGGGHHAPMGGGLRYAGAGPVHGAMHGAQPRGGMFGPTAGHGVPQVTGNVMGSGLKPRAQRRREDVSEDTNLELTMAPDGGRQIKAWSAREEAERINVEQNLRARGDFTSAPAPFAEAQPYASNLLPGQSTEGATYSTEPTPAPESWPKFINPEKPYDGMDFEDGSQLRPASKSGWTTTYSVDNPYRVVYDPTEFMLFHLRKADGTVIDQLEPRNEEMDYLDHELDPALRKVQRDKEAADGPTIVPTWGLAARMRQVPEKSAAVMAPEPEVVEGESVDTSDDLKTLTPVTLDSVAQVHTRKEAELRLAVITRDKSINPSQELPAEFYYEVITPVVTERNLVNAIRGLEGLDNFAELNAKLAEFDGILTPDVKKEIDVRLTTSVNQALEKNLGLAGWKIDSYFADMDDLLRVMVENFNGSTVLVDALNNYAVEVIGRSLAVLSGDAYSEYMRKHYAADDEERMDDSVLLFRDRASITQVPWNFADLNINLNGGGMVPEASMPQLYAAVKAIFERTIDYPVTWAHRYLQTADKKLIELRRGYLGQDVYLMFPAE